MKNRTIYILITVTVAYLAYGFAVAPLRNAFDDRWPYINVFLNSPGGAAKTTAVLVGLILASRRANGDSKTASLFATGFALMLLAGLMNALYAAWLLDHRTELKSLIFDHPFRLAVWKWYFRLDINQSVDAVGMVLVVLAAARSMKVQEESKQMTKP